jgi:hypothetical protein
VAEVIESGAARQTGTLQQRLERAHDIAVRQGVPTVLVNTLKCTMYRSLRERSRRWLESGSSARIRRILPSKCEESRIPSSLRVRLPVAIDRGINPTTGLSTTVPMGHASCCDTATHSLRSYGMDRRWLDRTPQRSRRESLARRSELERRSHP